MKIVSRLRFVAETARLMRSQWWDQSRIDDYQDARLVETMRHAVSHVPHYRTLDIDCGTIDSHDNLTRFPVITKVDLQANPDDFRWPVLDAALQYRSRTSGTTGEPTDTYFDHRSWLLCKYALKARRVLNAARPFGQRLLVVSEQSDNTNRTLQAIPWGGRLFATLNLHVEQSVAANVTEFFRFHPSMIYGTPSYLEYLAESTLDKGHSMPEVPVIFTSGEIVTEHIRGRLEDAYSGQLFDVYGSTEFKEIAVQCEYGQYHINFESVFVESHPDPDSSYPHLLLTSLVNKAMPLIRYDIGDHGLLQDRSSCDCGRHGPCIVAPQGRKSEMLRFPGGVRVASYTLTKIIEEYPAIKNYTIVHRSPLEISLQVYAEPSLDHSTRSAVLADLADKLPADVRISIETLAERLPATKRVAVRRDF